MRSYNCPERMSMMATAHICQSTMPVAMGLWSVMSILLPILLTACILQCLGSAYLRSGQV